MTCSRAMGEPHLAARISLRSRPSSAGDEDIEDTVADLREETSVKSLS
jgi:hypothetical protein